MAKQKTEVKQPGWLNKKEICLSLGITPTAFDKWGLTPVGKIGREVFFTCRQVLDYKLEKIEAKYQAELPESSEGYLDLDQQRARKAKADADAQEMKNAVMRRELAPVKVIELVLGNVGSQIGSYLDTIKNEIKRRVPGIKAADLSKIEAIVVKARNAASELEIDWDAIEEDLS